MRQRVGAGSPCPSIPLGAINPACGSRTCCICIFHSLHQKNKYISLLPKQAISFNIWQKHDKQSISLELVHAAPTIPGCTLSAVTVRRHKYSKAPAQTNEGCRNQAAPRENVKQEGRTRHLHPLYNEQMHMVTRNIYYATCAHYVLIVFIFIFKIILIHFHIKFLRSRSVDFHTDYMFVFVPCSRCLSGDTCLLPPVGLHTCNPFADEAPAVYSVTWLFPQVFARSSAALALLGNIFPHVFSGNMI